MLQQLSSILSCTCTNEYRAATSVGRTFVAYVDDIESVRLRLLYHRQLVVADPRHAFWVLEAVQVNAPLPVAVLSFPAYNPRNKWC